VLTSLDSLQVPADLIERYDKSGPRYTSYPTVPSWSAAVDDAAYRSALVQASAEETPIALYAHFAYCAAKCFYCGCNALTTGRRDTVDRYLDTLEAELDLVVAALGEGRAVAQMHWGGGTPNFLDDTQLIRAFKMFSKRFSFTRDVELSVEADPRLASPKQLRLLRALGFTRISFGVQDLEDDVQDAIGRVQPVELVQSVYTTARAVGFAEINLDLIYGLPRQTRDTFARTLEQVIELRPDRVACFGYAHMPAQRLHQRVINERELPDAHTRFELFRMAASAFTAAGYSWIGLDHFARADDPLTIAQRDGRLHRNFMGYTTMPGQHLVAVGMSAISDVAGHFAQNEPGLSAWRDRVSSGRLPTLRGHVRSDEDHARQNAILHLMCNLELPYDAIPGDVDEMLERFRPYVADGLATSESERIVVTPLGRFFLRNLCMELDAYLPAQAGAGRFSRTV
jgi:oxygen-independent coproporphyrinogen-3 oxidase